MGRNGTGRFAARVAPGGLAPGGGAPAAGQGGPREHADCRGRPSGLPGTRTRQAAEAATELARAEAAAEEAGRCQRRQASRSSSPWRPSSPALAPGDPGDSMADLGGSGDAQFPVFCRRRCMRPFRSGSRSRRCRPTRSSLLATSANSAFSAPLRHTGLAQRGRSGRGRWCLGCKRGVVCYLPACLCRELPGRQRLS